MNGTVLQAESGRSPGGQVTQRRHGRFPVPAGSDEQGFGEGGSLHGVRFVQHSQQTQASRFQQGLHRHLGSGQVTFKQQARVLDSLPALSQRCLNDAPHPPPGLRQLARPVQAQDAPAAGKRGRLDDAGKAARLCDCMGIRTLIRHQERRHGHARCRQGLAHGGLAAAGPHGRDAVVGKTQRRSDMSSDNHRLVIHAHHGIHREPPGVGPAACHRQSRVIKRQGQVVCRCQAGQGLGPVGPDHDFQTGRLRRGKEIGGPVGGGRHQKEDP